MTTFLLSAIILVLTLVLIWVIFIWKKSSRNFRKQLHEWEYMMGNIPDVLIKLDGKGIIKYLNPAAILIFNNPINEYIGKDLEEVLISEGFSDIEAGSLKRMIRDRQANIIESQIKDNKVLKYLEIRIIPGPVSSQLVPQFICLIRDTTKRKLSELSLIEAKQKAMESDRLKSAFLANMSHEIRTPLNAIVGFTQIILEEDLTQDEKTRYFEYIYQNSNQLINLINDIIDISKLESQQLSIRESTVHLNEQLEEIKEVVEHEKKNRDKKHLIILMEKEFEDSKAEIVADPYRLRQVLLNLLVNAVKFTPKGFIQYGYRLINDNKLLFFVRDSGVGIEKDKTEEIFFYFRQLEQSLNKNISGTGLGLAISRNLVNLMGGTIWVESEPGKGSTFYFTLPYKKPVPIAG